jgi:hypothetical protein
LQLLPSCSGTASIATKRNVNFYEQKSSYVCVCSSRYLSSHTETWLHRNYDYFLHTKAFNRVIKHFCFPRCFLFCWHCKLVGSFGSCMLHRLARSETLMHIAIDPIPYTTTVRMLCEIYFTALLLHSQHRNSGSCVFMS